MEQTLERFVRAQKDMYETARQELLNKKKKSHWMWYIFPQLHGLGHSSTAVYYSIKDAKEARAYLEHPLLGKRLRELSDILLSLPGNDPRALFGFPDDRKLRSCMTLFYAVSKEQRFQQVIVKYYRGIHDQWTLHALEHEKER